MVEARRYRAYKRPGDSPILKRLGKDNSLVVDAIAAVLPFRTNDYVLEELIDWDAVPDDPIYQLVVPQPGMLEAPDLRRIVDAVRNGSPNEVRIVAHDIRTRMNPHPGGQAENVPETDHGPLSGVQHKYRETVLLFPSSGQTCHAYCSYCFRWPQFVGEPAWRFMATESESLAAYLRARPEICDVVLTGGDPLVMSTERLRHYLEPLLAPDLEHITIRIGTKAPAYWPYRFLTDPDADDLLRLFEDIGRRGRHLALMAHYSHVRELSTPAAKAAIARLAAAGVTIRTQAPIIRHVNDDPTAWADLWREQVRHGMIPYYMFIARDTGPRRYFEVALSKALAVFTDAYRQVSGLARTVRGPVMSTHPGKILVDGVAEVGGRFALVLKMLQGRDPAWVNRMFFAVDDPTATWIDELKPLDGGRFFFEADSLADDRPVRSSSIPVVASQESCARC